MIELLIIINCFGSLRQKRLDSSGRFISSAVSGYNLHSLDKFQTLVKYRYLFHQITVVDQTKGFPYKIKDNVLLI